MFGQIRWQIAVPYVLLILAVMIVLMIYLTGLVRQVYQDRLIDQLASNARLLADLLSLGDPASGLNAQADRYARQLGTRVTLIAPDGVVIGESHKAWQEMDNHLSRPEVQQALAEGTGSSVRLSDTLKQEMLYVAIAVRQDGALVGFVRLALPLGEVDARVGRLEQTMTVVAGLTTMLAVLLALFIASFTVRPVRQLTEMARRVAGGDLDVRFYPLTFIPSPTTKWGNWRARLTRWPNNCAFRWRHSTRSEINWRLSWTIWPVAC